MGGKSICFLISQHHVITGAQESAVSKDIWDSKEWLLKDCGVQWVESFGGIQASPGACSFQADCLFTELD